MTPPRLTKAQEAARRRHRRLRAGDVEAGRGGAVARGGDLSPDWRVVPVWLVEIEPHTAEFHAAHEDEDFRERSEVRAKALSDLAAMDGEHL